MTHGYVVNFSMQILDVFVWGDIGEAPCIHLIGINFKVFANYVY